MYDLTVLIQGKIIVGTKKSTEIIVKIIRRQYPNINIVLSVWNDDNISPYLQENCNIIQSSDPGAVRNWNSAKPNNINRQIISTLNGLRSVKTDYVVKIRTDFWVDIKTVIRLFDKLKPSQDAVLISGITTKNPLRETNGYFHFCDWLYCGKTERVMDFFDIPLFEASMYSHLPFAVAPEQHLSFSWLMNKSILNSVEDLPHSFNLRFQNEVISRNLVVVSHRDLKIRSLKLGYSFIPFGTNGFKSYTHLELLKQRGKNIPLFALRNVLIQFRYRIQSFIIYSVIKFMQIFR